MSSPRVSVTVSENGPYLISGIVPLSESIIGTDAAGYSEQWQKGKGYEPFDKCALCRCGKSQKAPFCDGTHAKVSFDGTETASRVSYKEEASVFEGPVLSLLDARHLCADARFCDANGKVWNQVAQTDDPAVRAMFLQQVHNCPAGRLVAYDKTTGATVDKPRQEVSINLIEDPAQECSGPIWLRGGILLVSADGYHYETREDVTLCRCGASKNKPFCDGSHATTKFNAKQVRGD